MPHLSHNDGKKVDLAFYYRDENGPTDKLRSPIGYFAFEYPTHESCPETFPTLRWDFPMLQPIFRDLEFDEEFNHDMLIWLRNHGRDHGVSKVFVEPHLLEKLSLNGDMFRFQGCRAARHDDHIHIQVK